MEDEVKQKSIFEGFIQNLTVFYLLLIFLGYISTFFYYHIFGIPIFDYFSVEDFINIFFKNFVYSIAISFILIIASLIFTLIPILIFWKGIYGENEKVRDANEKWKKRIKTCVYIGIVLLSIYYLVKYLIVKDIRSQLLVTGMIGPIILGALLYFRDLMNKHKLASISRSQQLIIFVGIMLIFFNYWIYYAQGVRLFREDENKQNITFYLNNNNTIITSDSILFVGKSTDYMFFYDKKSKQSIVYDKSLIESIVIDGKEKVNN